MAFQSAPKSATFRDSGLITCSFSPSLAGLGGEALELPTGQETLTALRTGEGGGEGVGRSRRGSGGNGRYEEGDHEQGRQDHEECIHPLIQGD